jgi:hypothetical protein
MREMNDQGRLATHFRNCGLERRGPAIDRDAKVLYEEWRKSGASEISALVHLGRYALLNDESSDISLLILRNGINLLQGTYVVTHSNGNYYCILRIGKYLFILDLISLSFRGIPIRRNPMKFI